jgi:hypothetical protein
MLTQGTARIASTNRRARFTDNTQLLIDDKLSAVSDTVALPAVVIRDSRRVHLLKPISTARKKRVVPDETEACKDTRHTDSNVFGTRERNWLNSWTVLNATDCADDSNVVDIRARHVAWMEENSRCSVGLTTTTVAVGGADYDRDDDRLRNIKDEAVSGLKRKELLRFFSQFEIESRNLTVRTLLCESTAAPQVGKNVV